MKIPFRLQVYLIFLLSLFCITQCYEVNLSKHYIKTEQYEWNNFTLHIQTKDYEYPSDLIIMEVNYTSNIKVSPKIVEIHTKNFTSWCHMFHVYAVHPGLSKITFNFGNSSIGSQTRNLHVDVDIIKMKVLEIYEKWCAKCYYVFSVVSVYPQLFLQFLRLSVVGLDMDYVCFNFIGHLSYSVYAAFMFTQTDAFSDRNTEEEFPVTIPEIMFAVHGLICSVLLGLQAVRYYGVDKRVSVIGKEIISFYGLVFTFGFLLAKFHIIQYLDFLYISKYIYLASASTKYIPQIYKNYLIKSTFGWNIWNSNLESLGCIAIIANIFMISFNYNNWIIMATNEIFWMACAILLAHVVLIVQHYFIYQRWSEYDLNEFQEITLSEKMSLYEQKIEHC